MATAATLSRIQRVQAGASYADVLTPPPPVPPGGWTPIQKLGEPWLTSWWPVGKDVPTGWAAVTPLDLDQAAIEIETGRGVGPRPSVSVSRGSSVASSEYGPLPLVRRARGFRESSTPTVLDETARAALEAERILATILDAERRREQRPPRPARVPRRPRQPRAPRAPRRARYARRPRRARRPRTTRPPRAARSPRPRKQYTPREITSCRYSCGDGGCWSTGLCYGGIPNDTGYCCYSQSDGCGSCVEDGCKGPAAAVLKEIIKLLPKGWFPNPPKPDISDAQKYRNRRRPLRLRLPSAIRSGAGAPAPVTAGQIAKVCVAGWACRDWPGYIICPNCSAGYKCGCSTPVLTVPASACNCSA